MTPYARWLAQWAQITRAGPVTGTPLLLFPLDPATHAFVALQGPQMGHGMLESIAGDGCGEAHMGAVMRLCALHVQSSAEASEEMVHLLQCVLPAVNTQAAGVEDLQLLLCCCAVASASFMQQFDFDAITEMLLCTLDQPPSSLHLMLASGCLSYLVRHRPNLERRVLTEANILQLLRLATQKGAYLDEDVSSRFWTRWACQTMLRNLLNLEVVQELPAVQQLLQQFWEKWLGRIDALAAKCADGTISYAGGVEVLDAVLEELKHSDIQLYNPNAFSTRKLVALAELCALAEPQSAGAACGLLSNLVSGCLRSEAIQTPELCDDLISNLLNALAKLASEIQHPELAMRVQEHNIPELLQSLLQTQTLQMQWCIAELRMLAYLQPMQAIIDTVAGLLRAYPALADEHLVEHARSVMTEGTMSDLQAVAIFECRMLPGMQCSRWQDLRREIVVKFAKFLSATNQEFLQLPFVGHQLLQEPNLADSVVAILHSCTSVQLANLATSVVGSMSLSVSLDSELVHAFISANERRSFEKLELHAKMQNMQYELNSNSEMADAQRLQLVRLESQLAEQLNQSEAQTNNSSSAAYQSMASENAELRAHMAKLRQQVAELQTQLTQAHGERESLSGTNSDLRQIVESERTLRNAAESALKDSELRWRQAQDQLAQKESLVREWRSKSTKSEAMIEALHRNISHLDTELKTAVANGKLLAQENEAIHAAEQQKSLQLEEAFEKLIKLVKSYSSLQEEEATLKSQLAQCESEARAMANEKLAAVEENSRLKHDIEELHQSAAHQASLISDLTSEVGAYENRVLELKRTLDAKAKECAQHETNLHHARAEIEAMEREKLQLTEQRNRLEERVAQQEAAAQKQSELIQFINKLSGNGSNS